jgi:membrane fusion protein (multidrug efflux system)
VSPIPATIVAIDARVDPATRNAVVRARIADTGGPAPGASVRVRVPVGPLEEAIAIPVQALRKGPEGDHVFVIAADDKGQPRAHARTVEGGPVVGGDILVLEGLSAGEQVAASGSFKLRESVLVAIAPAMPASGAATPAAPSPKAADTPETASARAER